MQCEMNHSRLGGGIIQERGAVYINLGRGRGRGLGRGRGENNVSQLFRLIFKSLKVYQAP